MQYNPSSPGAVGLEWWPSVARTAPIAVGQTARGLRLPSLGAETIAGLRIPLASNPAMANRVFTLIDVFQAGNEIPSAAVQTVDYAPNSDGGVIGNWTTAAGGVVNLFQSVDEAVAYPPVGSDYIRHFSATTSSYRPTFASSGFSNTARVVRLKLAAVIGVNALPLATYVGFSIFHVPSATPYEPPGWLVWTNGLSPNAVVVVDFGEINPVTLRPWTPADIQEFDTGGDWVARFVGNGTGANGGIITSLALRVDYLTTENRVAVGTYRRPAGAIAAVVDTDAFMTTTSPFGATWAKSNGVTYTYVPRVAADLLVGGSAPKANDLAWRAAVQDLGPAGSPAGQSAGPGGTESSPLVIDANGLVTSAWASDLVIPRLVVRTSAPADSADSQAYLNDGSTTVLRNVTSAQPGGQRFVAPSTRSYLGVRFLVAPPASGAATLTVGVFTGGGFTTPVGGTLVLTADQIRALPEITGSGGLRYVQGVLTAPAALTAATTYEVRMTPSTGTWKALAPSAVGAGGVSLGGTTWFAQIGGGSATEQELAILLLEQPAAPTAVTAQVIGQLQSGDGCFCTVSEVDQVILDWTASNPALAGTFARYEIERDEDDGRGFLPVWAVTTEATTQWTDYEAPMDRPVRYRVRSVATTTAFSAWASHAGWVTCLSRGAEVVFTSNHDPGLQLVYDHDPKVSYDFLDSRTDVVHRIYGGDGQVAFFDPNRRGIAKTLRITANFGRQPVDGIGRPIEGEAVFEPLLGTIRATTIPYVCVRKRYGSRGFAHVQLASGVGEEPGWRYFVDADVTPLQTVPTAGTSA
jgi:hypothetical protein